jgi:hypothetical protein
MAKKKPKKPAHPKRPAARPSAPRSSTRRATPSAKPARPSVPKSAPKPAPPAPAPVAVVLPRNPDERVHVLSLSFVRDGDEFLARIETNRDQIIELKNRSLDQLLTLVASELEDLLE